MVTLIRLSQNYHFISCRSADANNSCFLSHCTSGNLPSFTKLAYGIDTHIFYAGCVHFQQSIQSRFIGKWFLYEAVLPFRIFLYRCSCSHHVKFQCRFVIQILECKNHSLSCGTSTLGVYCLLNLNSKLHLSLFIYSKTKL